MDKLRYVLSVVVGLTLTFSAGAIATAPNAEAGNNITFAPNTRQRIVTPRLRLRVVKPDRVLPVDDGAQPATGNQPAHTNQTTKRKPPAKKRQAANPNPPAGNSRTAGHQALPGLPNDRPVFFPDELERHPLGLFLAGPYDPNIVLALLREDADPALAEAIADANEFEIVEILPLPLLAGQLVSYRLPPGQTVHDAVALLGADPRILDAQPNFRFGLSGSAAVNSIQYAPKKINVVEAHRIAKGRDVLVAVIDSGIDAEHPELSASVVEKFDAIDFDPAGGMRHGTAMAAVIAANSQLLGIAPSVRLLSARAFGVPKGGSTASATTFAILKSMQWSFDRGARIFNLSFAGPRDPALMKGLDALAARDVIMVAAAGNAGPDAPPAYPGAHSGVIAVTATDTADVLFDMANSGKYVALAAPGVDVLTATPGNRYELMSGTSVAAAHVTGVVALMMEKDPGLTPAMVLQALSDSAIDLGPEGPDRGYGAGLVDALGALEQTGPKHLVAAD